jgi:hypothetical protein
VLTQVWTAPGVRASLAVELGARVGPHQHAAAGAQGEARGRRGGKQGKEKGWGEGVGGVLVARFGITLMVLLALGLVLGTCGGVFDGSDDRGGGGGSGDRGRVE